MIWMTARIKWDKKCFCFVGSVNSGVVAFGIAHINSAKSVMLEIIFLL